MIGVMTVTLLYFAEFVKHAFQHIGLTASICGGIYARAFCILLCVHDVLIKKVHVCYLIVLSEADDRTIVSSFVWTKHRKVTDGQADGRTDSA